MSQTETAKAVAWPLRSAQRRPGPSCEESGQQPAQVHSGGKDPYRAGGVPPGGDCE